MTSKNFIARAEQLREAKKWTWGQAADALGVSRTMVHFIKTGKNAVTDKVAYRLEKLEVEAGLLATENAEFYRLSAAIAERETRTIPDRLDAVRLAKHLTWEGVASLLEISPSMIYQVKRGERTLGDMVLHRLEEAEIAEGLLNVQGASFARLLRNPEIAKALDAKGDSAASSSPNDHIRMRLDALADIVDTYDSGQMDSLLNRLKTLATSDKQFGKVFDQMTEVVTQLQFRKQQNEDAETPRKSARKKSEIK